MRNYENNNNTLKEVHCNKCGKILKVEKGIIKEGCYTGCCSFGYFSRKDGERHMFDLCEDCYDAITRAFLIPVEQVENTELL